MSVANGYAIMAGLKACVLARLPTYLNAVEVELGVTIPDPEDYILGYREVLTADRYPVVCFVSAMGTPEMSAQSAWVFNPLSADIVVALKESTPEALEKAMLGYADAILNLLAAHRDLDGACDQLEIETVDWYHGAPSSKEIGVIVVAVNMHSEIRV